MSFKEYTIEANLGGYGGDFHGTIWGFRSDPDGNGVFYTYHEMPCHQIYTIMDRDRNVFEGNVFNRELTSVINMGQERIYEYKILGHFFKQKALSFEF